MEENYLWNCIAVLPCGSNLYLLFARSIKLYVINIHIDQLAQIAT